MNRRQRPRNLTLTVGVGLSVVLVVAGLLTLAVTDNVTASAVGILLTMVGWALAAVLAVRYKARADLTNLARRSDVNRLDAKFEKSVGALKVQLTKPVKAVDHRLARVEKKLDGVANLQKAEFSPSSRYGIDVLFVTSNGAGLGHISRSLAIARELPDASKFELLTLSKAYDRLPPASHAIHYFPSNEVAQQSAGRWNQAFLTYLLDLLGQSRPKVVVFDGTWVYAAVANACKAQEIPLVWVQRGMWRPEVAQKNTQRTNAHGVADAVIVPGDYAGDDEIDAGARLRIAQVSPIVQVRSSDVFTREESARQLGLDPRGRYVLVSLGGGTLGSQESVEDVALAAIERNAPGFTPIVVRSPLARVRSASPGGGAIVISAYPVMQYARLFDFAVCAAGYNSAQEVVALRMPALLIPNELAKTDDQRRRADQLAKRGLCVTATDPQGIAMGISSLSLEARRAEIIEAMEVQPPPDGAKEAANLIGQEVVRASWVEKRATIRPADR